MTRFLGRKADGSAVYASYEEIISNALQQEAEGIEPHYCFYDQKEKKTMTAPGWLVWSLYYGCGVVYRRPLDGKMIIVTGVQGDFCYC